jgi:hypothetical protein
MEEQAIFVLHVFLGIVYLITAWRIWQDPKGWSQLLLPWARKLLPTDPVLALQSTAGFDAILGIWLITGLFVWVAAILSILHMLQVLITTGLTGPEYRDIAILGASIALLLLTLPPGIIGS